MSYSLVGDGVVRRLWPSDLPAFRDHLLRLDKQSRHDRFAGGVSESYLRDYAEHCFGFGDIMYGYFVDGLVRGAGELRGLTTDRNAMGRRTVEAAFSVEIPFRRRGVGSEFLSRIIRAARNRGADTLFMTCLADNRAMQKLAQKFEAELTFETDAVTGRLIGKRRNAASVWDEAIDDAASLMSAIFALQVRACTWNRPHG